MKRAFYFVVSAALWPTMAEIKQTGVATITEENYVSICIPRFKSLNSI